MLCSICNQEHIFIPATHGGAIVCQMCATRLTHAAPALLRGCEQAADLLGRLNTPNAPTWAEVAELRGRMRAVAAMARGAAAVEAVEESWPR